MDLERRYSLAEQTISTVRQITFGGFVSFLCFSGLEAGPVLSQTFEETATKSLTLLATTLTSVYIARRIWNEGFDPPNRSNE